MADLANIETGVDKLVKIVAKEKRIALVDAAKQLGVEQTVVQEWADFLEQEGLVELQYSLSKVFIVEKRLTTADIEKKGKEYDNKKEAFVRKVDATLRQIEQETADFETIKSQYYTLKGQIGDEIDAVKDEIEQLRHYEDIRKSIDHDILKQKVEYQKTLEDIHLRITAEEKRYSKILDEMRMESEAVKSERNEFSDLKREEHDLVKRIDAIQDILKSVSSRVHAQEESARLHEERLMRLRDLAENLQKDLAEKKTREIEPLIKVSKDQAERIQRIQDDILKKVKERRDKVQAFDGQSEEILRRFEQFFQKRARTEDTIKTLEKAKLEMKEELGDLIRKAKAFDLASKGADVNAHVKELEGKFKEFDRKRATFTQQIEHLKNIIMGKDDGTREASAQPKLSDESAASKSTKRPTPSKAKPATKKKKR